MARRFVRFGTHFATFEYLCYSQPPLNLNVSRCRFENRGSCGFAPDAQLPDQMPVAFAAIHEPMIVEEGTPSDGFFAWVPDTEDEVNCNPNNENCGFATFTFSCSTDTNVGFEYELRAPSGDDNLLGLQINDGPVYNWNIPTTMDTHVRNASPIS